MHSQFWEEQPALLFGLSLLIGSSSALFWEAPWNWIFPFLWAIYLLFLKKGPALALLIGGMVYGSAIQPPLLPSGETRAYFSVSSVRPYASPFHKGFLYKGTIHLKEGSAPCTISYLGFNRPRADHDAIVTGRLSQRDGAAYTFKARNWTPVETSFSLAEIRFRMKQKLRAYFERKLPSPRTASFLGSLITGDVEDRSLKFDFGRLGLQHILAISGFHFAILIGFCTFFLHFFLPNRWKYAILLVAIHLYFVFVGEGPAVQRSWLTAELYLIGKLIGRHTTGLNLLGIALLAEMILDPLAAAHLGFQLSYLCCFGILLFCSPFERALRFLLPKRKPPEYKALAPLARHASLLCSFLRQSLAIGFAVNLAIFPLLLFHFHRFPLLSLLYNLFFPFLVSGALFLLLLSLLCPLLFPVADFYTAQLLELAAYPPIALDYSLTLSSLPAWPLPFYLFALFCLSFLVKNVDPGWDRKLEEKITG